jgi:signal transduction histidine kinase
LDRIRPLAVEHAIEIECALAPAWTVVSADELGQLITNLLVNAVDFSGPGGVIRVSVRNERGAAVLVVEDTGAGIAAADLPHVFERFYRADRSRSRAGHSGLGLAICKSIVDAAGGMIDVSSRLGVGTTVTVRFPGVAASRPS